MDVSPKPVIRSTQVNDTENSKETILYIKELDATTLKPYSVDDKKLGGGKYAVIGRPGTGKSELIRYLMFLKAHIFPTCIVFSASEEDCGDYAKYVPPTFIHGGLDKKTMDPIRNFTKRQQIAKQYLQNPWCMLILDDCMSSVDFMYTREMQHYYKNGRHLCNMSILSSQYLMDIKVNIRSCFDGIFILQEPSPANRERLWKNYGGCIPTLADFNDLMDQLTTDFTAMYIDCKSLSTKIEDTVFWFKAKPSEIPNDWKFGHPSFWEHSETRCAPNQHFTQW